MQVRELYEQVSQLGFEDSLENDKRFYYAANRGLLQVNAIRPAISHFVIPHLPVTNKAVPSSFAPIEKGDRISFTASDAKAFYFAAMGKATASIYKEDGMLLRTFEIDSVGKFTAYRGFIKDGVDFVKGSVRLVFTGEYVCFVKCVAMYDRILSDRDTDIPVFAPFVSYDIGSCVEDFLSLDTPPMDAEDLVRLDGRYRVEGNSVIMLPYEMSEVVRIRYKRRPRKLEYSNSPSADTTEIDLDEELCSVLPLIIASYIWAEDEPSLAQYYLALYNSRAAELEYKTRNYDPVIVENIYER